MSLAGKKIAVWFRGRQVVHHVCVDRSIPTDQSEYPGTYLAVIEYDDMGQLAQLDVHADQLTITATDGAATIHGPNISPVDLDPP